MCVCVCLCVCVCVFVSVCKRKLSIAIIFSKTHNRGFYCLQFNTTTRNKIKQLYLFEKVFFCIFLPYALAVFLNTSFPILNVLLTTLEI